MTASTEHFHDFSGVRWLLPFVVALLVTLFSVLALFVEPHF